LSDLLYSFTINPKLYIYCIGLYQNNPAEFFFCPLLRFCTFFFNVKLTHEPGLIYIRNLKRYSLNVYLVLVYNFIRESHILPYELWMVVKCGPRQRHINIEFPCNGKYVNFVLSEFLLLHIADWIKFLFIYYFLITNLNRRFCRNEAVTNRRVPVLIDIPDWKVT